VANPPQWYQRARFGSGIGSLTMPGISAGVKAEADLYSQPSQPSKMARNMSNPAAWSYVWAGLAFTYLVSTYLGILSIRRLSS
jgi:hypothetical protein